MRILTLENHPQFGGGCESLSFQLSTELAQRGHHIFLAYETEGSQLTYYRNFATVEQMPLPVFGWRTLPQSLSLVQKLAHYIRKQKIDVIFSSHLGHLRNLALIKSIYNIPTVYYLGLPSGGADSSKRWALKKISAGVACSGHIADSWRDDGWPERTLRVVPHWIDTEKFKPAEDKSRLRRELNLPDKRMVLFLGRVVEDKGVENLIRSCSGVNAQLVIVGPVEKSYEEKLLRLEKMVGVAAIHVGPTREANKYFAATDIAVVPSICKEGFGIVAIEAMATKALTIVSTSGELPNVVGNRPELIFRDVADLNSKLTKWLSNGLENKAEEMYQFTLENYTQKGKLEVYEELMLRASKTNSATE